MPTACPQETLATCFKIFATGFLVMVNLKSRRSLTALPRRFDKKSDGILAFGRLSDLVGRLSEVFGRLSDVFGRLSDVFGWLSDVFGRLSDVFGQISRGFRTAFGYRGRLFANLDGFSLS